MKNDNNFKLNSYFLTLKQCRLPILDLLNLAEIIFNLMQ